MDPTPRQHFHPPHQTTPDIYSAVMSVADGVLLDDCCFYEWTMTLTRGGRATLRTARGDSFDLSRGDLVLTRPRIWHAWRNPPQEPASPGTPAPFGPGLDGCWEIAYAVFNSRPHWSNWLDGLPFIDNISRLRFDGKDLSEVERVFMQLARTYAKGGLMRDERATVMLELLLITIVERTEGLRISPDQRIRDAVEYIQDRYAEALTVSELAAGANLSTPHFATLFASSVGMPPARYIEQVRLDRAAEMLRFGNAGIGEVSRLVGYAEPKYFTHRFRLRYGFAPREFRRVGRAGARPISESLS